MKDLLKIVGKEIRIGNYCYAVATTDAELAAKLRAAQELCEALDAYINAEWERRAERVWAAMTEEIGEISSSAQQKLLMG